MPSLIIDNNVLSKIISEKVTEHFTLQYSCLGNPMVREAWWATVHGVRRAGHEGLL